MNHFHITRISEELNLKYSQVQTTAELLEQDATVPFIARYRKEATGSLDEVAITSIRNRLAQLAELDRRRDAIIESLTKRELLTDELSAKIAAANTMAELEDIYLPYRPKRRTRAAIAREKGLEPLAEMILAQDTNAPIDLEEEAAAFVDNEKGVNSIEDALAGARDIIAEQISENQDARAAIRKLSSERGVISSSVVKCKEEAGAKFKDYFTWNESVDRAPSHRVLAMMRGEKEGVLKLDIAPPTDNALAMLSNLFVFGQTAASAQVEMAATDSYKRLLGPSMETEIRNELKRRADQEAIRVFSENLRELLLAPPLGRKNVLAIDPGFRTGCKVVCLDPQGKLIHNDTIFPHSGDGRAVKAAMTIRELAVEFKTEVIAIGNGTASRETEEFVRSLDLPNHLDIVMVNESGASIYSASEVAREEFPDEDVTVRGSVSIGRRLMDPLAELVKIDPKSIGVGQYQHDVDQNALKQSLDDVVICCVNRVGVDVNSASKQLLTYVSGLGSGLAQSVVNHRNEHGAFRTRKQLLKVKGLGPKAFEQSAGFLRIPNAENPLDASAVHPESYHIVDRISDDLGCSVKELMSDESLRKRIRLQDYVTENVGLPTLEDILEELAKPGRDPRRKFEVFRFADGIETIQDLHAGMVIPGIVTNVTAFGAFVDIGVHQDGLVHISQLADKFVRDPNEIVRVQQKVKVRVLQVDTERQRISLSMKGVV